jgi:hypothetical protein
MLSCVQCVCPSFINIFIFEVFLDLCFCSAQFFYHKVSELDTKNLTSTYCVKSRFGTLVFCLDNVRKEALVGLWEC